MNWVIFLIPISAIVMSLGIGMLHLWTDHQRKSQLLEHTHRERMAAIEKGVQVPPTAQEVNALTARTEKLVNPARVLRTGVFMVSFGVVLYFALDRVGATDAAIFGLIPATLGLANLAYAAVLFNKDRSRPSP